MEYNVKPNDTITVTTRGMNPIKFVIKRMSTAPFVCIQEVNA